RYSSGMYVRLAFAVAAHLEPEILVIDEVLAVGDAQFQRKCLGKMQEVGRQGRTVLFVSHTMPAIIRLCNRAVLLRAGRGKYEGAVQDVIGAYLNKDAGVGAQREWADVSKAPGDDVMRMVAVRARLEDGRIAQSVNIRNPVVVELEYEVLKGGHELVPSFHL